MHSAVQSAHIIGPYYGFQYNLIFGAQLCAQ
jgi:hypothetical protein